MGEISFCFPFIVLAWVSRQNVGVTPYTIITAEATKNNPGISVKGFIKAMKKFHNENFELNSPAIREEQEVIFPLQKKSILSIEKIK